jgi:UPF0755 protein
VKKLLKTLLVLGLLGAVGGLAVGWKIWSDIKVFREMPYGSADEKVIDIPPGTTPRVAVRLLVHGGALSSEQLAWQYIRFIKRDPRHMRHGEYAFAGPMTPDMVLERLYRGEVKTYRYTIPEGLRMEEIAALIAASGLAKSDQMLALMKDPALMKEMGVPFVNAEGFLFPDTYNFPKGVKPQRILKAMVDRYREAWKAAEAQRLPGIALSEPQAVTLASIVEKETGQPVERGRISCVFHNRLKKKMKLQTDPTVMYATALRTGVWSKNITKTDLGTPHPYNTYTTVGLPPGPIASPGAAALAASLRPDRCDDLYFVSRNDGSHIFCPDLKCHNAAVQKWQVEYFKKSGVTLPGVEGAPVNAITTSKARPAAKKVSAKTRKKRRR